MKPRQIRQGDVLLQPVRNVARKGERVPPHGHRVVLAEGEATGHAHTVEDRDAGARWKCPPAVLMQSGGRRFLFVDRPSVLRHQEHRSIQLTPGVYELIRQREFSPIATAFVGD
jgi:hypothetical protein